MSELSPLGGSEGYGACDDAADVGDDGKAANFGLVRHIFTSKMRGLPTFHLVCSKWLAISPFTRSPQVWTIWSRD